MTRVGRHTNIFLIGMMGAGKTTAGRLLARRLGWRFIDTDHEIETRCGVGIPVIFEIEGEAGFREREARVVEEFTALEGVVLATGGGVVLRAENRNRLAARGTVIYLHAPPEALYRRVRNDRNRPLLAAEDPLGRLRELYTLRDPLYREIADFVVETGVQSARALSRSLYTRVEDRCKASA
ncbi:MAG: shikimate kinase [Betaproteobacteria bacterium]|nr:shikimate kinase [Betaproteobacteria bacterium]